jgi:hypothetical protein
MLLRIAEWLNKMAGCGSPAAATRSLRTQNLRL